MKILFHSLGKKVANRKKSTCINIERDWDKSSNEKKNKQKKGCKSFFRLLWVNETLTDRSVCDVNETADYIAHLIFMTKTLVGTTMYFDHLIFTITFKYSFFLSDFLKINNV